MTALLRDTLGEVLRAERIERGLTLREVSSSARVSLGYISEIERGQKEASSELLAAIRARAPGRRAPVGRGADRAHRAGSGRGGSSLRLRPRPALPHALPGASTHPGRYGRHRRVLA